MVQGGATWYRLVQLVAGWCNLVQVGFNLGQIGAVWCNLVQIDVVWWSLV